MTFSLVLTAALALPGADPAAPGGQPPEQAVAVIDAEGTLKITHVSCVCSGMAMPEPIPAGPDKPGGDKAPAKPKVKVSTVLLTTAELPAKMVEAYTADGTPLPKEKLAELLKKERTVLVAMDGKKVDPFYLELYKEGTVVLVPPADTFAGANVGGYGSPYYPPVVVPAPPPLPPERPLEKLEKKP
jgi:hypothetical protein